MADERTEKMPTDVVLLKEVQQYLDEIIALNNRQEAPRELDKNENNKEG